MNTPTTSASPMSSKRARSVALAILCGFGAAACGGSYPPPNERMANTTAAVRAAEEVGGQSDPQAALYLKLAEEQVEKAKQLMATGENQRAEYVLQRADADAELSLALARSTAAKKDAQKAKDELAALKKEAGQKP